MDTKGTYFFLPSVDSQSKIFVGVNKLCQSDGDRVG